MKTIKLELHISRQRRYYIMLLDEDLPKFKNKKEAENYVQSLKRTLRQNVTVLNLLNSQLYNLYAYSYLQFDSLNSDKLDEDFYSFRKTFNRIFTRFSPGNNNHFLFHNIALCFDMNLSIVEKFMEFAHKHKNAILYQQSASVRSLIRLNQDNFLTDWNDLTRNDVLVHINKKQLLKIAQ